VTSFLIEPMQIFLTLFFRRKKRDGLDRFGSDDEHAQYQRRRISFFKVFVVIHDYLQRGPLDSFAHRVLAVDLRRQDGSGP